MLGAHPGVVNTNFRMVHVGDANKKKPKTNKKVLATVKKIFFRRD